MKQTVLSVAEWARRCGITTERACQVLRVEGLVPEAIPLIKTPQSTGWVIPEGTPYPASIQAKSRFVTPTGYLTLNDFARKHGKSPATLRLYVNLGYPPPGAKKFGKYWGVPEDSPWTPVPKEVERKRLRPVDPTTQARAKRVAEKLLAEAAKRAAAV